MEEQKEALKPRATTKTYINKNIKISIKVREKYCIKKEMVQQKDIVIREEKEKTFKIQK